MLKKTAMTGYEYFETENWTKDKIVSSVLNKYFTWIYLWYTSWFVQFFCDSTSCCSCTLFRLRMPFLYLSPIQIHSWRFLSWPALFGSRFRAGPKHDGASTNCIDGVGCHSQRTASNLQLCRKTYGIIASSGCVLCNVSLLTIDLIQRLTVLSSI